MMHFAASIRAVASAAHGLWCDEMTTEGWNYGEELNADLRTHPWARPFEELSPFDQDRIVHHVHNMEELDWLSGIIDRVFEHPEWSASDLPVGTRVTVFDHKTNEPATDVSGVVAELTVANPDSGLLESIRVEWDDGTDDVYPPDADYLVPIA